MATINSLLSLCRSQLGDIVKLSKERRIQEELIEAALFSGIQVHNRFLTWSTLPPEEEQLILILAKSRICRDKAAEYALDPKLQAGSGYSREKVTNASVLSQMAREYMEEYEDLKRRISAQVDGDIVVGTLTRESRTRKQIVPSILAAPPQKPVIESAKYVYDPDSRSGGVSIRWHRISDQYIAYIRLYLSQSPNPSLSDEIIRTFYDLAFWSIPPLIPVQPVYPQIPQQAATVQHTVLPTGRWYLRAVSFNWNGVSTEGDPVALDVVNSRKLKCDSYAVMDDSPITSTSTTSTTTTTTTTP